MLTLTTLASGSSGNCLLLSAGETHLLVDAGISCRRICRSLRDLGVDPSALSGVLVTHEHTDHVSGLATLTKQLGVPVYATAPTLDRLERKVPALARLGRALEAGTGFQLGELWVESFSTPHDAAGSVGYAVTGGGARMALATDLGHLSSENNTPARAREVVSRRLSALGVRPEEDITLAVAPRSECGALYRLERGGALRAFPAREASLC
mgnify:CR=1 FL=1